MLFTLHAFRGEWLGPGCEPMSVAQWVVLKGDLLSVSFRLKGPPVGWVNFIVRAQVVFPTKGPVPHHKVLQVRLFPQFPGTCCGCGGCFAAWNSPGGVLHMAYCVLVMGFCFPCDGADQTWCSSPLGRDLTSFGALCSGNSVRCFPGVTVSNHGVTTPWLGV